MTRSRGTRRHHLGPVARDVASTFTANVIGAGAAFIAGIVLAGWLGPTRRGQFEVGAFITNGMLLVLGIGINIPIAVFHSKQPARSRWAYRLAWGLIVTYAAVGLAALWGGRYVSSFRFMPDYVASPFEFAVLFVFVTLFGLQITNARLIGAGRIHRMNVAVGTRWVLYLGLLAALAALVQPSAAVGLAAFGVGTFGGLMVAVTGPLPWPTREATDERLRTLWFGLRGQLGNVFQFASYRFDVLLVRLWVGTAALGVYSVGVTFAEAVWLLPNAVGTVLLSHTSRSSPHEADQRMAQVFPLAMGIVVAGAGVLAAMVSLVTHLALGPGYRQVPKVTWILLPGAIMLSGSKILANDLTARGFPGINTIIAASTAGLVLLGDVILIPHNGIIGAAIASSVGYSLSFVLTAVAYSRRARLHVRLSGVSARPW